MRRFLTLAAALAGFVGAGFAIAQPARALVQPAAARVGASDTMPASAVPSERPRTERWHCTPTGCAGARPSSGSAALGFAATTLAAVWIARRRPIRPA